MMYEMCHECGCFFDPGEIHGGICDECREKAERQAEDDRRAERLLDSGFRQMTLSDMLYGAGPGKMKGGH